ncbi:MAG: tripartite tricarboxylate transporter substrate binding protein [Deltaproteobacteria bacterium]|nr:tripartite tricarboxylate transporter substrate binding protein [Deltaproteobacteria bacterium]
MKKFSLIILSAFLALMFLAGDLVVAMEKPEGYPKRAIEFVIRSGPGSGAGMFAQAFAKGMKKALGVPIKFSYKPGAGGQIAVAYFLDQPADGHTLLVSSPTMVVNTVLGRAKYQLDDIIWLALGAHDIEAIHTRVDSKFQTLKDIQDYCQKNPKLALTIAGAGALSFDQMWVELLNKRANIRLKFVPFEKSSMRRASFQAGHTDLQSDELIDMEGLYKAGISKPLVIGYHKRVRKYPDVQCTGELGVDVTIGRWRGIVCKKGTPEPVVKYLEGILAEAFKSEPVQKYLEEDLGHERTNFMGREEYTKLVEGQRAIFREMLKEIGFLRE